MNTFTDKILQFVNKYYIDPIIYDSGYNPVNTLTWALILGACVFGVIKLLDRMKVEVDERFIFSIIPFVLAGSSLRVLEDANVFSAPLKYLFITPNIYFVVFVVTLACLVVSKKLYDLDVVGDWKKTFAAAGGLWFLSNLYALLYFEDIVRPDALVMILVIGTLVAFSIYGLARWQGIGLITDRLNFTILWVHLMDASSTFIGIDMLGYYEKHVVPAYLIDLTGTALVMYPLKLAIFIPVIYVLDSQFNDSEESISLRTFVKMVIIVLGLSPATRNTLRMALGI
ncbi:DUF63 family protein [Methanohalophilus portucalensis]|uniref:DUF63 family protein n=2 Tax=Methanohalophilus portucalensis TaxID=39664 RepID=A0A1L9C4G9_9EURY|nr:DUF63 family protein [Methanohalophilus portucalensis]ATU07815.1 hypothetical protein BKM01_02890 [Methanohalophilus portucalensis]OJH49363.1 hypothetical protein MPF_1230 [Methanohalophilus portucalensis FDF-1]RNI11527.1 DUF63 family protein [Methanohalophilus portucalensis FDF-1]SMH41503.1 Uncharacterized membrane protein [Methanohalophilus portucalensis FDF-1]